MNTQSLASSSTNIQKGCWLFALAWVAMEATAFLPHIDSTRWITQITGSLLLLASTATPILLAALGIKAILPTNKKQIWGLLLIWATLGTFLFITLKGIGNTMVYSIEGEGIRQVSDGLKNLQENPSLGAFGTGYYHYPARQYALQALPTLICGRGVLGLQLGGVWLIVCGAFALAGAMKSYLGDHPQANSLTALAVAGSCLPNTLLVSARWAEQTSYPPAVTILFLASYILWRKTPSKLHGALLTVSTTLLFSGYTPAFATGGLAVLILLVHTLKKNRWIILIVFACLLRIGEFHFMNPAKPPSGGFHLPDTQRLHDIWAFYSEVPQIPTAFLLIVILAVAIALRTPKTRFWLAVATTWAAGVLVLAHILHGSFYGSIPVLSIRHQILHPVLAVGVALILARPFNRNHGILAATAALVFIWQAPQTITNPNVTRWSCPLDVRKLIDQAANKTEPKTIVLVPNAKADYETLLVKDYLTFVYPKAMKQTASGQGGGKLWVIDLGPDKQTYKIHEY